MKKSRLAAIFAAALMLCACGEKNKNVASVAPAEPETKSEMQEIIKDAARQTSDTLEWGGAKTLVKISRTPDNDGQTVTDEDNIKYVDNVVNLRIISGGKAILDKEIRKSMFRDHMSAKSYAKYVLEWIVYNKTENGNLVFSASVANPAQEDEFLSFAVAVSPNGGISVSKEENPVMASSGDILTDYD